MSIKHIFAFLLLCYSTESFAQKFNHPKFDFGIIEVSKTKQVDVNFFFSNEANQNLLILKTQPSCSCMAVKHPQMPIKPGDTGLIKVTINTDGQIGEFNKTIIVRPNIDNEVTILRIVGTINP